MTRGDKLARIEKLKAEMQAGENNPIKNIKAWLLWVCVGAGMALWGNTPVAVLGGFILVLCAAAPFVPYFRKKELAKLYDETADDRSDK